MKLGGAITFLLLTPIFALFGAVGIWAYQLSLTWDERHTDQLLAGGLAVCGLGTVCLCLLAYGIFRTLTTLAEHRADREMMMMHGGATRRRGLGWGSGPPLLSDDKMGSWEDIPDSNVAVWQHDEETDLIRPFGD